MPVATHSLELPLSVDDLWLSLGDVPSARPCMQGDVFTSAAAVEEALVIVLTHPCSMRAGSKLRPRQTVVAIKGIKPPNNELSWKTGHYDYMPLPGVKHPSIGNGFPVADFREIESKATEELGCNNRVAALSHEGILHLQQRLAHHLTRAIIDLPTLARASDAVLAEADLQEEWVEGKTQTVEDDSLEKAINAAAKGFQDLLDSDNQRLREKLRVNHTRPDATREIRRQIYGA